MSREGTPTLRRLFLFAAALLAVVAVLAAFSPVVQAQSTPYVEADTSVCGLVTLHFYNPTRWSFTFDYKVDGAPAGIPDEWSDYTIGEGPLKGQLFGLVYTPVGFPAMTAAEWDALPAADKLRHEVRTIAFPANSGTHTIEYSLRRGAEQNWYIDWQTITVDTDCTPSTSVPSILVDASACGQVTLHFYNPTRWEFTFDYRVDNTGTAVTDELSDIDIVEGPWAGQKVGPVYNPVLIPMMDVAAWNALPDKLRHEARTITFPASSGTHRVDYWLRRGAEQNWYLATKTVYVNNGCALDIDDKVIDLDTGIYDFEVPVLFSGAGRPVHSLQFDLPMPNACLSVPASGGLVDPSNPLVQYSILEGGAVRVVVEPTFQQSPSPIPVGTIATLKVVARSDTRSCILPDDQKYAFAITNAHCGASVDPSQTIDVPCTAGGAVLTVDYNEPPVVSLSDLDIVENAPSWSANLTVAADDDGDGPVYTFSDGCAEAHNNGLFTLAGAVLSQGAPFDYETVITNPLKVCIAADDQRGSVVDTLFSIAVLNELDMADGDCNANGAVNATDLVATVLEVFDEGSKAWGGEDDTDTNWLTAPYGTFRGSPEGCNSNHPNGSTKVDAADVACTVNIIFNPGHVCSVPVASAAAAPAYLAMGKEARANGTFAVPIVLEAQGHPIVAVGFTLRLDASVRFDAADADNNGVPDAVAFHVPDTMLRMAQYNAEQHVVRVVVADVSLPLSTLDGAIATVSVQGDLAAPVVLESASAGSVEGADVPLLVKVRDAIKQFFNFLPTINMQ